MPRGRPFGHPQPAGFGRFIGAKNKQRPLMRRLRVQQAHRSRLWRGVQASRKDELGFLGRGDTADAAASSGVRGERKDKTILPGALIAAALSPGAERATGLGSRTCHRAEFLCAACLLDTQEEQLGRILGAAHPWVVWKRSADETLLYCRAEDGSLAPTKILNSRGFVRWGAGEECSRILWPAVELLATDALALAESFDRVMPVAAMHKLEEAASRTLWWLQVHLGIRLRRTSSNFMPQRSQCRTASICFTGATRTSWRSPRCARWTCKTS